MPKIFATNAEVTDVDNKHVTCSQFVEHYSWIISAIFRDTPKMLTADVNTVAQARRGAVLYIDKPICDGSIQESFDEMNDAEIQGQLQALESYHKN